jgi:ribonuclease HI
MAKERRIIYTDATIIEQVYRIAMYDTGNNATHIVNLKDTPNITEAELQGVLYAVLYIVENNIKNAHILTDNQSVTNNKSMQTLCSKVKCTSSWIPREINTIADKIAKLEPTKKDETTNRLYFLYSLLFENKKEEEKKETNNINNSKILMQVKK